MTNQYLPPTDAIRLGREAFCETPRRRIMRGPAAWATFALSWALVVGVASGAPDTNWTGGIGQSWNDSWNWTNGVPSSALSAHIDQGRAYMNASEGSHSAYDVFLGTWDGNNGALWMWPQNSLTIDDKLVVGWYGTGDMRIHKFSNVTVPTCIIGNMDTGHGTVLLEGSASWERAKLSASTLIVGGLGWGSLRLDNGRLTSATTHVGDYYQGYLTVDPGSLWENSGDVLVGPEFGGTGVLNVTSGQVIIGGILKLHKYGTLNLTGGSIKTNSFIVDSGGTFNFHNGTLRVEGGTFALSTLDWAVNGDTAAALPRLVLYNANQAWSNDVTIGSTAKGEMVVLAGTPLTSMDNGYLGFSSGSTGTASVSGAGSTWEIWDNLYIGGSSGAAGGTGRLTVSDSGHVDVGVMLKTWNKGTLELDGGSIKTQSFDRSVGTFNFYNGTLTVDGGSFNWGATNLTIDGNSATALPALVLNNATPSSAYGEIRVADSAMGALTVSGGTDLHCTGSSFIGRQSGAAGTVDVTGSGTTWSHSGGLYIGGSDSAAGGAGTVGVSNSAQVSVGGTLKLWGGGALTLDDGSITTQSFDNGDGGTFNFHDGTLTVNGGTFNMGSGNPDLILEGAAADDTPALVLNGANSTTTFDDVYAGNNYNGQLTVSGGTVINSNSFGVIANNADSSGTVTVEGKSSTWYSGSNLFVGHYGDGRLYVNDGGQVSSANGFLGYYGGSNGSVSVDGANSAWTIRGLANLYLGEYGKGGLTISHGGDVSCGGAYVASRSGSGGSVYAEGAGSSWTVNGSVYIGGNSAARGGTGTVWLNNGAQMNVTGTLKLWDWGYGTLIIEGKANVTTHALDNKAGGQFTFRDGTLTVRGGALSFAGRSLTVSGQYTGEKATLLLDGAPGSVCGELTVGTSYEGEMTVSGGTSLTSQVGAIGRFNGSTGTATVTDAGTSWTSGTIYLGGWAGGADGTGSLTVTNGGQVNVTNALKLYDGGTLVLGGGSVTCASLDNTSGGQFSFTGGELHVDTYLGNLINDGGAICPGGSPGLTTVQGDLVMNAGLLEIELGGLLRGDEYDAIVVTGLLELGGTLDVLLYDAGSGPFAPQLGDAFDILDWGSLTGQFGQIDLPAIAAGLNWDTSALYTTGQLSVVPEPTTLVLLALAGVGLIVRRRFPRVS